MRLTLTHKKFETSEVATFIFEPEVSFSWTAGQYLRYTLRHEGADDRGENRFFTIASAPFEGFVQLTTRFSGEKGSSFKKALLNLEVGAEIEALGPLGTFVLDGVDKEYILIAGGIGITPFRSMILEANHEGINLKGKLMYANRDDRIIFKEELKRVGGENLEIIYFIDPVKIDALAVKRLFPDLQKPLFYISGPKPMVENFDQMLKDLGVAEANIKNDFFPGY